MLRGGEGGLLRRGEVLEDGRIRADRTEAGCEAHGIPTVLSRHDDPDIISVLRDGWKWPEASGLLLGGELKKRPFGGDERILVASESLLVPGYRPY